MKRLTESEKSMIQSCFTYEMLWLDSQYLAPIVARVGVKIVEREIERLSKGYRVETDVYTDSEGCTYNKLVKV